MTKKLTPVDEARQQMQSILTTKANDLTEAETRLQEASVAVQEAQRRSDDMTAVMDLAGFEAAQDELKKAILAEQMYRGKLTQLEKKKYITEEESNAVIDALLAYEDELGQAFEDTLRTKLMELKTALDAYKTEIRNTETTIDEWTGNVFPNYRSKSSTYTGPDGQRTNRASSPQPVHPLPYTGNSASQKVHEFLTKMQQYTEA